MHQSLFSNCYILLVLNIELIVSWTHASHDRPSRGEPLHLALKITTYSGTHSTHAAHRRRDLGFTFKRFRLRQTSVINTQTSTMYTYSFILTIQNWTTHIR